MPNNIRAIVAKEDVYFQGYQGNKTQRVAIKGKEYPCKGVIGKEIAIIDEKGKYNFIDTTYHKWFQMIYN